MAIVSTTDVVQNVDSTREVARNGSVVCSCLPTGQSHSVTYTTDLSMTYAALQTKYTDRFDELAYYNAVDGGSP